jgi:glycine hydroxymethyltransferase
MITTAQAFAEALDAAGIPVFAKARGFTGSYQFAIEAARFGGGQTASKALRKAGFLTCGIGLPIAPVEGDLNGLRIGTPELVRWGATPDDARNLAGLVAKALKRPDPETMALEVAALRKGFSKMHYIRA